MTSCTTAPMLSNHIYVGATCQSSDDFNPFWPGKHCLGVVISFAECPDYSTMHYQSKNWKYTEDQDKAYISTSGSSVCVGFRDEPRTTFPVTKSSLLRDFGPVIPVSPTYYQRVRVWSPRVTWPGSFHAPLPPAPFSSSPTLSSLPIQPHHTQEYPHCQVPNPQKV